MALNNIVILLLIKTARIFGVNTESSPIYAYKVNLERKKRERKKSRQTFAVNTKMIGSARDLANLFIVVVVVVVVVRQILISVDAACCLLYDVERVCCQLF